MGECLQIGVPGSVEKIRERHIGLNLRPQCERIYEHADQIVERLLAPPRDGGTDSEVAGTTES